jgi:hypothetical protein
MKTNDVCVFDNKFNICNPCDTQPMQNHKRMTKMQYSYHHGKSRWKMVRNDENNDLNLIGVSGSVRYFIDA